MNRLSSLARTGLLCLAAASIPLSTGCGTDIGVSGSTGTGGHTNGVGGGCSVGVTTAGVGGSTNTGVGGSQASTSSTGGGVFCGGIAGTACAADEYCDFPSNSCGFADESGTCTKRPIACDDIYFPTCGCDGQIYGSDCTANSAGHDVAPAGTCTSPVGMFACGQHFCDPKIQYCQLQISDVATEPNTYTCTPLPAGCVPSPSCPCLVNEPCSDACTMQNGGGLQLSCPGG
jgi:hypothetical protein